MDGSAIRLEDLTEAAATALRQLAGDGADAEARLIGEAWLQVSVAWAMGAAGEVGELDVHGRTIRWTALDYAETVIMMRDPEGRMPTYSVAWRADDPSGRAHGAHAHALWPGTLEDRPDTAVAGESP
jgi:hypothetical protein